MKSKKERLENLDEEKFCFDFFDGTRMPNNPKFINITMFIDTFFLENEKEEKENYGDMYFIILVKKLIEENLENIEKMASFKGLPVKSSFEQKFYLKIDSKTYRVNRNVCTEEGQKLFDDLKSKLYKILDINK